MGDIDHKIDTNGMAQPTNSTCWLACYKMLLKKAGKDNSETAIRAKLKTFNINFDDAYSNGLDSRQWSLAAFALGQGIRAWVDGPRRDRCGLAATSIRRRLTPSSPAAMPRGRTRSCG